MSFINVEVKDDCSFFFKVNRFSVILLFILPMVQNKHNKPSKMYRSMCFLSSYEHLKFDLDKVQTNMLK